MGGPHNASRLTHCAYVSVFRTGFQGSFIFENAISKFYFRFSKHCSFRAHTSVFEKVNKTPLMFTPITSKIKHVKTNEHRGCSNLTTLLS